MPRDLRPHLLGGREAPSFLTSASLDGEAEETQLASVAGLALNAWTTGALPGLGVTPVLLGAQRVTLAATTGEGTGSETSGRDCRSHPLHTRPHLEVRTRQTAFPKLCPRGSTGSQNATPSPPPQRLWGHINLGDYTPLLGSHNATSILKALRSLARKKPVCFTGHFPGALHCSPEARRGCCGQKGHQATASLRRETESKPAPLATWTSLRAVLGPHPGLAGP